MTIGSNMNSNLVSSSVTEHAMKDTAFLPCFREYKRGTNEAPFIDDNVYRSRLDVR